MAKQTQDKKLITSREDNNVCWCELGEIKQFIDCKGFNIKSLYIHYQYGHLLPTIGWPQIR